MALMYHIGCIRHVKYGTLLHSMGPLPCLVRASTTQTYWVAAATVDHTFSSCRHRTCTTNSCEPLLSKRGRGSEQRARIPLSEPSSSKTIASSHADITGRPVAIMRKLIACES